MEMASRERDDGNQSWGGGMVTVEKMMDVRRTMEFHPCVFVAGHAWEEDRGGRKFYMLGKIVNII